MSSSLFTSLGIINHLGTRCLPNQVVIRLPPCYCLDFGDPRYPLVPWACKFSLLHPNQKTLCSSHPFESFHQVKISTSLQYCSFLTLDVCLTEWLDPSLIRHRSFRLFCRSYSKLLTYPAAIWNPFYPVYKTSRRRHKNIIHSFDSLVASLFSIVVFCK